MTDLPIRIRPMHEDERAYVLSSWFESVKHSPRGGRLTYREAKQLVRPELEQCLDRPDSRVLVADYAGDVAGWLLYSPGWSVDVVHWALTRCRMRGPDGAPAGDTVRRRGVFSALLNAAQLKPRVVYTYRGIKTGGTTLDVAIADHLRSRGIIATHVPYSTWRQ